jgi:AraC-like DNA-binding protein
MLQVILQQVSGREAVGAWCRATEVRSGRFAERETSRRTLRQTHMFYRCRVPRPPLDAFVQSIWVCRNAPQPHALERILPTGAAQLIVNLKEDRTRLYDADGGHRCVESPGTILSGVWSRYQVIDTTEQEYVAGVAFKPGGTVPFVRTPAHEIRDADIPLDTIWNRARTMALRERLLEAVSLEAMLDVFETALLGQMYSRPGLHPAVGFALAAFDRAPGMTSIATVTRAIGMSAKRFIERFKIEVGVTPKRYCRIRRFQDAVTKANRGGPLDWARVAQDCGYFDQAHFIHDFRSFAGLTPTGYLDARTAFQNHVKFLQSDAAGI